MQRRIGGPALALTTFVLVTSLANVGAVAEFGLSSIAVLGIAGLVLLLPTVLIPGELATAWPHLGGVYLWVRLAFGSRLGFLAIWFQWLVHIIIIPSVVVFVAATAAWVVNPDLASNRVFLTAIILIVVWLSVALNLFGIRESAILASIGALAGVLIPAIALAALAIAFLATGGVSAVTPNTGSWLPGFDGLRSIALFAIAYTGFAGLEISANVIEDVERPRNIYRRAISIAAIASLGVMVVMTLAVIVAVPDADLDLVTAVIQAFKVYLDALGIGWLLPVVAVVVAAATIGQSLSFMIGPAEGIKAVADRHGLPTVFSRVNRKGAPFPLLILQGVIATIVSAVFLLTPSVSQSFAVVELMAIQLYIITYVLMYVAVIRLRDKFPDVERPRPVPGGKVGLWLTSIVGVVGAVFVFFLGFVPPAQFDDVNLWVFEGSLIAGIIVGIAVPFSIRSLRVRPSEADELEFIEAAMAPRRED